MKSTFKFNLLSAISMILISSGFAYAVPVITIEQAPQSSTYLSPWMISSTDLLQTNLASISSTGTWNSYCAGGVPCLTNGFFGIRYDGWEELGEMANGNTLDYYLDITVNTSGYNITSINTYGGWKDGGRDQQTFEVWYSVIGNADWIPFDSVNAQPASATGMVAIHTEFVANLTNVDALHFVGGPGIENGWAGMGEIDVFGTAVPEPATVMLISLGALAVLKKKK